MNSSMNTHLTQAVTRFTKKSGTDINDAVMGGNGISINRWNPNDCSNNGSNVFSISTGEAVDMDWPEDDPFELPDEKPGQDSEDTEEVREEVNTGGRIVSSSAFVDGFVAPDFVIDGLIQRGFLYSLTARTGDGKTAWGVCTVVKHGAGIGCEKLRILYLAGENPDDIRARFIMACEHQNVNPSDVDVWWLPGWYAVGEGMESLKEEAEKIGEIDIIFIDTSAAYFSGDDENSNTQLGAWARELRKFCSFLGKPAVVVFCHPIKSAKEKIDLRPRGGGAFVNEVDGNLCILSEDKGQTFELHWTEKLRGPGFEPIPYKLEKRTSASVKDSKGRLIPSVIALPMTEEQVAVEQKREVNDADTLLENLLNYPSMSFRERAEHLGWVSTEGGPNTRRFYKAMEALEGDKLVERTKRKGPVLTAKGRREAQSLIDSFR